MNKQHIFLTLICFLSVILLCAAAGAQEVPVLDASALQTGDAFGIIVSLTSDDGKSFSGSQIEIHAELCSASDTSACKTMDVSASGTSEETQQVRLSVDTLPLPGDYRLTVEFSNPGGEFLPIRSEYLLTGVRAGQSVEPSVPEFEVQPVTLTPSFMKTDPVSGLQQYCYFGEQIYTGNSYSFGIKSDIPLGDDALLRIVLPEEFSRENLNSTSSCLDFYTTDSEMLIPGSELNSFVCSFSFARPLNLYNQMMHFSLESEPQSAQPIRYSSTLTDWYNFPMVVTKQALSHQLTLSDSRGNLLCSDTVPCQALNADDVFTLTYHYPSDWVSSPLGSAPADALGSARVTLPEAWTAAIRIAQMNGLLDGLENPCSIGSDGTLDFTPQYHEGQERYTVSCQFAVDGGEPGSGVIQLQNDNLYYQLADLNLQLPYTLQKAEVSLTPSLTLRMSAFDEAYEQIAGGAVSRLYRTADDYGDTMHYTLKAVIGGVSAARIPQPGDAVHVNWSLLDTLAYSGALPSCLSPDGTGGYILGSLEKADGNWEASCEFSFPSTLNTAVQSGPMSLSLDSSRYRTSASVWMPSAPFTKETLYLDIDTPSRFFLSFPQEIRARLSGANGSLGDYQKVILQNHPLTLSSDWTYNYLSDCYGNLTFDADGNAVCAVRFDSTADASSAHFSINGDLGGLADVILRSPADYSFPAVTPVQAQLIPELLHNGNREELPASDDSAYTVSDEYSLKFRLVPAAGFDEVINSAQTDSDGGVTEWGAPLTLRWSLLNGGYEVLAFRKNNNEFEASYDFGFDQGNIALDTYARDVYPALSIPGWEIDAPESVRMPGRIDRKTPVLTIMDLADGTARAGKDAEFEVRYDGDLQSFNMAALHVGLEENGFQTPILCSYDGFEEIRCTFPALCNDQQDRGTSEACSSGVRIYAEYDGDAHSEPAAAVKKDLTVSRSVLTFENTIFGSLDKNDIVPIRAASDDLMYMDYGSVQANGIHIDRFLPAKTMSSSGWEYRSYPFSFTYSIEGDALPDNSRFFLDVTVRKGSGSFTDEVISIPAASVSFNEVRFDLDFGGRTYLENGYILKDALADVTSIEKISVRYDGDPMLAASSRTFEAEGVEFALKVASVSDLKVETSGEHQIVFAGAFGSDPLSQSYTIYCSQLAVPLHCYAEEPKTQEYVDENEDGIDDWTGLEIPEPEPLPEDGCWGLFKTEQTLDPTVYAGQVMNPQCYLTAIKDNAIMIASNVF